MNSKNISLPMSRVKLIMKSSPDVSSINQDALFLTTKATVRSMSSQASSRGDGNVATRDYRLLVCQVFCFLCRNFLFNIWHNVPLKEAREEREKLWRTVTWLVLPRRRRHFSFSLVSAKLTLASGGVQACSDRSTVSQPVRLTMCSSFGLGRGE